VFTRAPDALTGGSRDLKTGRPPSPESAGSCSSVRITARESTDKSGTRFFLIAVKSAACAKCETTQRWEWGASSDVRLHRAVEGRLGELMPQSHPA